jgi:NAD(P)-dependent dehydrogenase (short-subunit alcohol dehydrogenase family)
MGKFLFIGGTRGLGLLTAELFNSEGHDVILVARNQPARAFPGKFHRIDISDLDNLDLALEQLFNEEGAITGGCFFQRLRPDSGDLEAEIRTSVIASKKIVEKSLEHLDAEFDHPFTFVSSVNSKFVSRGVSLGYHISKASIDVLVKFFAVHYGDLNARFNTVNPSTFVKPENQKRYNEHFSKYEKCNPLNRLVSAMDVANTVLFASSAGSRAMNGANLFLDNGTSIIWPEGNMQ